MKNSLAILDWGIGGMGFYRVLKARSPNSSILYWSDAGSIPYGKMSRKELVSRLQNVSDIMIKLGASKLVIACNAASTVLPDAHLSIPNTGMLEHAVRAVKYSGVSTLGIVGGRRTVLSRVYRKLLPDLEIRQRVAQPLSAHVEAGRLDAPETLSDLKRILKPLRGAEGLLLACTHYPAISRHFAEVLPGVVLIDPVEHAAEWVLANWELSDGEDTFLTTGDPIQMRCAAHLAFGVEIDTVYPVSV